MSKTALFRRPGLWRKKMRAQVADEYHGERQTRQPFSDGSEEFFEEFTPENRGNGNEPRTQDVLVGLGVTLGLVIGVGATLWLLKKRKARRKWLRRFS